MNTLSIRTLTSSLWSQRLHSAIVGSLAALSVTAALAADPPVPSGVVALTASASVEVTRDLMAVTLSATREGTDASTVQSALKQALDAALLEARGAARPGQIDVRTGNFSMNPRYSPKGLLNGWQGTAELVIEGRDLTGIGQLAGRIQSMTIARVAQGLSREQREKAESGVTAQAIARYRAQAAEVTKQFGYTSYSVREVSVNSNEQGGPEPMMMRAKVFAAAADAPLPVEAGQTSVTVTVSGTVQMLK
ncbi:MAG: SIMPL domain-containing protein [Burkholderiales bacterium PBB1]|nr:MAG: SIMPL domain-containing protein [Burkholderiales bacterium PBB1]